MRRTGLTISTALLAILVLLIGSTTQASTAMNSSPNQKAPTESNSFSGSTPKSCDLNTTVPDPELRLFDGARPAAACSQLLIRLGKGDDATGNLPKVGEQANLVVKVTSDENQSPGDGALAVTLPAGVRFVEVPDGYSNDDAADPFGFLKGAKVKSDGNAAAASLGNVTLNPGGIAIERFRVEVVSSGAGNIEAALNDPVGGQGANDALEFTYTVNSSEAIYAMPDSVLAAEPINDLDVKPAPSYKTKEGLCADGKQPNGKGVCPGVDALLEPAGEKQGKSDSSGADDAKRASTGRQHSKIRSRVGAQATTCVTGRMVYSDQAGTVWPSVNLPVTAVDDNPFDTDTLATQVTDGDGRFNMCFDNEENSGVQGGTADVILQFKTQNQRWRVVNRCCGDSGWTPGAYEITTPRRDNIAAGTVNFGTITPADAGFQRALHLYDSYNKGWQFANVNSPGAGNCWAASDCDQKTAMWSNGYSGVWPLYGNCAARADSIVCLPANGPDWEPVVLHELGHDLMDEIYPGGIPDVDCPNPHPINAAEQDRCAWVESWPSWFSNAVMRAPVSTGYGGQSAMFTAPQNFELMGWQNYMDMVRGSNVEVRVTMALWDLSDSANESPYDRTSLGDNAIWRAFLSGTSTTLPDFVARLSATQGVDFSESSPARSTLYGNTIDLGGSTFRDPLSTGWLRRPNPPVSPPSLTAMPSGSSAGPMNTSNDHSFVWRRPNRASACPDLIQVEDTWGGSTFFRSTDNTDRSFQYNDFRIDAFSDAANTARIAATSAVDLQAATRLNLELPHSPRTVWLTTRGAAPAGETNGPTGGIVHGDWTRAALDHYRIRAAHCNSLQLGDTQTFAATNLMNSAIFLKARTKYVITAIPVGTPQDLTATNIALQVVRGRGCPKAKQSAKCKFDAQPLKSADKRGPGKSEKLQFTTTSKGTYRVVGDTESGNEIGWRVKIARGKG